MSENIARFGGCYPELAPTYGFYLLFRVRYHLMYNDVAGDDLSAEVAAFSQIETLLGAFRVSYCDRRAA